MSSINTLYIQQTQDIRAHIQNITVALASPTTEERYQALTAELDASFKMLAFVKGYAQTLFTQIATKALETELVSLCGRLTAVWMRSKVDQILKEAADLQTSLDSGHVIAEDVQKICSHMEAFRKAHLPSLEDRRELAKATLIIYRAQSIVEDKNDQTKTEIKVSLAAPLVIVEETEIKVSQAAPLVSVEDLSFSVEMAQEVFEIAFAVYRGDLKGARMKYLLLGEGCKKIFTTHAGALGIDSLDDSFESIQALIAVYNELLHIDEGYANKSQVEELFGGLAQALAEEKPAGSKIFSFKSTRSLLEE